MAKVTIEGHGDFTLTFDQTQELLSWLSSRGAAQVVKSEGQEYDGKTLLNEQGADQDTNPSKKPGGTWDFGTKWI